MAQGLDQRERNSLHKLEAAISLARDVDKEMAVQTLHVFLIIAEQPGITMADIQRKIAMSDATTSRAVSRLSEIERPGRPGLNWVVARENPEDRRFKVVELTTKGAAMARRLASVF